MLEQIEMKTFGISNYSFNVLRENMLFRFETIVRILFTEASIDFLVAMLRNMYAVLFRNRFPYGFTKAWFDFSANVLRESLSLRFETIFDNIYGSSQ